jgi:hypothetical protein
MTFSAEFRCSIGSSAVGHDGSRPAAATAHDARA